MRWKKNQPFCNWHKICCTERLGWKKIWQEVRAGNWKGKWERRSWTRLLNMENEFGNRPDLILTLLCIGIMTIFRWYGIFLQDPCLVFSVYKERKDSHLRQPGVVQDDWIPSLPLSQSSCLLRGRSLKTFQKVFTNCMFFIVWDPGAWFAVLSKALELTSEVCIMPGQNLVVSDSHHNFSILNQ